MVCVSYHQLSQLIYIRHTEESKLGSRVAYVLLGVEVQVKVQNFKLKHTYIATGHHNVLQSYCEEVTTSTAQYLTRLQNYPEEETTNTGHYALCMRHTHLYRSTNLFLWCNFSQDFRTIERRLYNKYCTILSQDFSAILRKSLQVLHNISQDFRTIVRKSLQVLVTTHCA